MSWGNHQPLSLHQHLVQTTNLNTKKENMHLKMLFKNLQLTYLLTLDCC